MTNDLIDLIKSWKKYHFLYVGKKPILLSSDNNLDGALDKLSKKIKPKLDAFTGVDIIRLKLSRVDQNLYEKSKTAKLTAIGGPISIEIKFFKVNSNGNLKIDDKEHRHDEMYITEKFIDDKSKLKNAHLKKIASKATKKQLRKTAFTIVTIDKIKV